MKEKKRILSIIAAVLCLCLLLTGVGQTLPERAYAATTSQLEQQLEELEAENDAIEAELSSLRGQLSDNMDEMEAMVAQKNLLDREIALLNQQMENLNVQISAMRLMIAQKQEEVDAAQANLQKMQEDSKARIRSMEENGQLSYWAVLFEANSFAEMLDRLEMIWEIAQADAACLQRLDEAAKEVQQAKEELHTQQLALDGKRQQMLQVQEELEEKRVETDAVLIELKARHDEFQAMIEESEALQEELALEIAQTNKDLEDAKYQQWLSTYNPATGSPSVPSNATWLMPCVYGRLSSPFGYRYHPISGIWKMHYGVDLTGVTGTEIKATRAGYVSVASYQAGGAGWYVSLNHGDGFGSIYMHMTHFIVKPGQYVEAGEVIGYMGSTGGSTGTHLHFGISYNGVYVNPADYLYFR